MTIDFFELDGREELWRERSEKIVFVFLALEELSKEAGSMGGLASRVVEALLSPDSPHTSCGRAFRALYEEDRIRAGEIARSALAYLESQS